MPPIWFNLIEIKGLGHQAVGFSLGAQQLRRHLAFLPPAAPCPDGQQGNQDFSRADAAMNTKPPQGIAVHALKGLADVQAAGATAGQLQHCVTKLQAVCFPGIAAAIIKPAGPKGKGFVQFAFNPLDARAESYESAQEDAFGTPLMS